jgi:heptosyltransferase-2
MVMMSASGTPRAKGRILVVRGGAIGDFVLTLPVFRALRNQFPDVHLEVLGYPHIAQLARIGGLVDQVRPIEARALAGFFAHAGVLDGGWEDYFGTFHLVVSYLYDPDGIFRQNVARCTQAQFIAGPHRPDESVDIHATEVFLKPLERLAIFQPDPVPRLGPMTNWRVPDEPTAQEPRRCLAVHPGSGSKAKNWPEPKWTELLARLAACSPLDFLLIGGEAEGDRVSRLATVIPPERCCVAQNLPLCDLAGRLARCAFFVGHDSGISHLAAAVGLPGIILWGPTNEQIWAPRSDTMRLLHASARTGLDQLSVETVLEAVREL